MTYTPGPWHVESKEFPIILDEQGREVTRMPFTEQGRRDARLAAVAPEFLEMAEATIRAHHEDPERVNHCPLCSKIQAVINKAIGDTP